MNLLLDTHIWLWGILEPDKLSRRVKAAMQSRANSIWLSPISVWECVMLVEKGRIRLRSPIEEWFAHATNTIPAQEAQLTPAVAIASRKFVAAHRDPADCLLAATASVFSLTLVTGDARLLSTRDIATLANS